jgi:choline-sulfatase
MKNRTTIVPGLLFLCLSSCRTPSTPDRAASSRPPTNILVIVGDDHATQALGAYGAKRAATPSLDRFAAQAVRFDRAYANNPVCTASRQSMLTGLFPHASGVTLLQSALDESTLSLADHLTAHGYRTAVVGKTHFNSASKHGFDLAVDRADYQKHLRAHPPRAVPTDLKTRPTAWRPMTDPARIWMNADKLPEAKYEDDTQAAYLVNSALQFVDEAKSRKQPFLVWLAFHEPHSPYNFPVEYADRVNPSDMDLPKLSPQDEAQVPLVFKDLNDDDRRGIIAAYHSSVIFLDAMIGRALAGLKARGLEEDTLIVYVSDHGYHLGQHGRFEKHSMYENSVRTPLLIRAPGMRQGRSESAFAELVDLFPTITDYAGLAMPGPLHGFSLRPVVEGKVNRIRPFAFSTYQQNEEAMVLTDRWKFGYQRGQKAREDGYIDSNPTPGRQRILYDVTTDPDELHNVAGDPRNAARVREMEELMVGKFAETWPKDLPSPTAGDVEDKLDLYVQAPEHLRKPTR